MGPEFDSDYWCFKPKITGLTKNVTEWRSGPTHGHHPLVGPRSRIRTPDLQTLGSKRTNYENWPKGSEFDSDYGCLKTKSNGVEPSKQQSRGPGRHAGTIR